MNEINLEKFKFDSKSLFEILKNNDLEKSKEFFEIYKNRYKNTIFDVKSNLYASLPFFKSVEEYLYSPLAKEKGIASLADIEYFFENDICNIK